MKSFSLLTASVLIAVPVLLARAAPSWRLPRPAAVARVQSGTPRARAVPRLLAARCGGCHSGPRPAGGLAMTGRESLLRGGAHGPAVLPERPDDSPLLQFLRGVRSPAMPLNGRALPAAELAELRAWIAEGAPWDFYPAAAAPSAAPPAQPAANARSHWAFQRLRHPVPPAVRDAAWVRNAIDPFILAGLEAAGLEPARRAVPRRLIRRVTFDLTGLPPTPAEVEAFVRNSAAESPSGGSGARAYERLVDRLLASPAYGERWARHWLDLARYADSDGYEVDQDRPGAYAYRDFVIRALNDDLRYDTFLRWQLAGDELALGNPLALAATGFCTAGPTVAPGFKKKDRYDELDDVVSTTGVAMLGLTVGCARCHDHKYDPISQREYYRMLAVFTGTRRVERRLQEPGGHGIIHSLGLTGSGVTRSYFLPLGAPEREGEGSTVTPGFLAALTPGVEHWGADTWRRWSPGGDRPRSALAGWITDLDHGGGALAARVIVNRLWRHHFGRGLVRSPGDLGIQGERPTHPDLLDYLAWRLTQGGPEGASPWSLKALHRLIVTSAAYQQDSAGSPAGRRRDPENRHWWRRPPVRLEGEALRDAILAASGSLNREMYGPGIHPWIPPDAIHQGEEKYGRRWPANVKDGPDTWRRSIYIFVKRSNPMPLLQSFDQPDPTGSCVRRPVTIVAPQALNLMNNRFVRAQAHFFAGRVEREAGRDPSRQARWAYRVALARPATGAEIVASLRFLEKQTARYSAAPAARGKNAAPPARPARLALADLCQVLFALNEFIYVD